MQMHRFLLTAAFCTAAVFLSPAAHAGWFDGDRVQGSGHVASETRNVTGYSAIKLTSGIKVVVRQSGHEGVELRADDNVLPLVETNVVTSGGQKTLELGYRKGASLYTRNDVVAVVDVNTLKRIVITGAGDVSSDALNAPSLALEVSGSGDIQLRKLQSDELDIQIAGSGDVRVAGRAAKLAISIAGSGGVEGMELDTDAADVSISGSGNAKVNARKDLKVSIAGSGDVVYRGDAQLRSRIAGTGSVTKR
jgi:hypothetical protein